MKKLLVFFILFSSLKATAFQEMYTSVRALGMGNAYTAIVDNSDAMFYNPAGLSRVEGINWRLLDPQIGLNGLEAFEKAQNFSDDGTDLAQFLNDLYGTKIWSHAGLNSLITLPGIGLGVFGAADVDLNLSNPAFPNLNLNYVYDYGLTLGFSVPVVPNFLYFGMVGRRTTRTGARLPLGVSTIGELDIENIESNLKNTGSAFALDLGVNLTLPGLFSPTLSFVWQDVGVTKFSFDGGQQAPPSERDEMIIGFGMSIDLPLLTITPAIDYKYANIEGEQFAKKLHLGIEFDLPLIDLRAGLNQGYWTLGASFNLFLMQIDAASYGVELGEYPGQLEDRRYIVQITFEFGFNPDFSISSVGGKGGKGRRRIKQRR